MGKDRNRPCSVPAKTVRNARCPLPFALVRFDRTNDWKLFDADRGIDSAGEIREYLVPDFSNWKGHDFTAACVAKTRPFTLRSNMRSKYASSRINLGLRQEAQTTKRLLGRVPQEKLARWPHQMSLGQLALHIVGATHR
jgi:hypothetical protein